MLTLSKSWSDLLSGYRQVCKQAARLPAPPPTHSPAGRDAVRPAEAPRRSRRAWWAAGLAFLLGLALAAAGWALLLILVETSPFLALLEGGLCAALPLALAAGAYALVGRLASPQPPVQAAPASIAPGRLAANPPGVDLPAVWWRRLSAVEVQEPGRYGDIGEIDLLRYLETHLPHTYLGLRGLPVARSLDADLIVVGPTGVWVFESKYWRGRITVRHGVWKRAENHWEPGGRQVRTEAPIEAFDQQWLRERQAVQKTLQLRLRAYPWLPGLVRGGLVFTHPDIELDIDGSCQVEYGGSAAWVKQMLGSPARREFSLELRLAVLDALLNYAERLDPAPRRSAVDLAMALYDQARRPARKD